jgi:pimeloyl-ACP methyl ester carboxylesterase
MTRGLLLRIAALVLSVALLVLAWSTFDDARRAADRATATRDRARQTLAAEREQLTRTRSDLAAARAAVTDFTAAAQLAVGATGRVVDEEAALTDRLARLQTAGAAQDIDGYNRTVDELVGHDADLEGAINGLDAPFDDYSRSLDALPTARCAGPVGRTVEWTAYGASGLQCARVAVPLDYGAPRGRQIELTVVRRPADDPNGDIGPLVINPGGPGQSAIAALRIASLTLPDEVLRRFDLIGVDPRGVGQSTPVDCADNLDPLFDGDLTDARQAKRTAALDRIQRLVHQCGVRSGALLRHLDTASTARDLDRVRIAMGAERISYLGFSYGTYLGSVYAELFPDHLRAAVLDGGVAPDHALADATLDHVADDIDDALGDALDDCAARPTCPMHNAGKPGEAYNALMAELEDAPIAVGPRTLGRGLAELGVIETIYGGQDEWPRLMDALAHARLGDGAPLLALSDSYTGRRKDGSYNNELEAHAAISCVELGSRPTPLDARTKVRELGIPSRFDTIDLMLGLPCAFWPAPVTRPVPHIDGKGAPDILVVGSQGDPFTPIEEAQALADALDSGHLLTYEGDGHTVVGRGNDCIDTAVTAYLVSGAVPADGATCAV